jgi:alkaline phosphatase D
VFSCSNFEKGYFNAYGEAAKDPDLFAVLHLGDYTYEYGPGGYVTPALALGAVVEPRAGQLLPTNETVLRDAYRQRQALYHTDPQLQALHAHAPWILIYDDHEIANDAWTHGAENHTPATEGVWRGRKAAALKAYYEWLPLREQPDVPLLDPETGNPTQLPRSFPFGRVARLFALDTRLAGRDKQLSAEQMTKVYVADAGTGAFAFDRRASDGQPRTLLGPAQEQLLDQGLAASRETWQLIGSQVLAHYQIAPDYLNSPLLTAEQKAQISALLDQLFGAGSGALFGQLGAAGLPNPSSADSWVGYPSARNRLDASLRKARNPVVLSGDSHNAWAANLVSRGAGGAREAVGVEFGTASVSSPGLEEYFLGLPPELLAAISTQSSQSKSQTDKLIYADTARRGFIKLRVDQQRVRADFTYVSTAFSPSYTVAAQSFAVQAGAKRIEGT